MNQGIVFGSGTTTRFIGRGKMGVTSASRESQTGSVAVTLTSHLTRAMVATPVAQRAYFRRQIIGILGKADNPKSCIDELLQVCTTEGGPDGLDLAIDVLSNIGRLILDYAWEYLQRDIQNWGPSSDRAYEPNDDYWYILLRAVGRADVSEKERFRLIVCCVNADSRSIREGVVEGLRDVGTPAAKERIRRIAKEDSDGFIKEIAKEALDDLES